MQLPDQPHPPAFITTTRNGHKWPPNRRLAPTLNTIKNWRDQDPSIASIARRPMPKHFSRAFAILGWREAPWYYRCSWRLIGRWVNEAGKEAVLAERAAMKKNQHWRKLKALMASDYFCEDREPRWLVDPVK